VAASGARHEETPAPKRTSSRALREDGRRKKVELAAERLFAERGFENVSVRDIAGAAGVTHPLIYYYWGSKNGLLAAVNERNQAAMRTAGRGDADPLDLIAGLFRENMTGSRTYLLTLTRAFLDGMRPDEWPGGFPGIQAAIDALERDAGDRSGGESDKRVRELVAAATAMLNGWVLIEDQLLEIVGLSPGERDHARETVIECMRRMLAPAVRPAEPEDRPPA
jgi:AcrR family transcriptional regulator